MPSRPTLALLVLGLHSADPAAATLLRRQAEGSSASQAGSIPLKLAGATCADPPVGLPEYCCEGAVPSKDYADTCDCNPGWTHQECVCKGILNSMPCHHCMVHLPGTNRWMKSFNKTELYANCNDCVGRCKEEMGKGDCGKYATDILGKKFPDKEPADVLCTDDYLKSQVENKDYPVEMKRVLYTSPKFHADEDYHVPSNWNVAGVR